MEETESEKQILYFLCKIFSAAFKCLGTDIYAVRYEPIEKLVYIKYYNDLFSPYDDISKTVINFKELNMFYTSYNLGLL